MRIAMASGKGGAGKTTVTASLASVWDGPCLVVDADVEAPNLHLYLEVPVLDKERCTNCGACREICAYKAIARLGAKIMIFPDMCHGCGGCFAVCEAQALSVGRRELGVVQFGTALDGKARFLMGRSRIGEAMTPPLLRGLENALAAMLAQDGADVLLDAPPGVSCPAKTVARQAVMIVLVAEPTPFGFHDFRLAHTAFSRLGKPLAVIMNRAGMPDNLAGDALLRAYCAEQELPLLAELPFERAAAESYARGRLPVLDSEAWRERFRLLRTALRHQAGEVRHA